MGSPFHTDGDERGFFGVFFGVVLSLVLGVLLAALHLVFKPVEIVAKPPETAESGQVYFIEGAVNNTKSRQWIRKRQVLTSGTATDVTFTEEELNAWTASISQQAAKGSAPIALLPLLNPERVNFRIRNGTLQVALLGKLTVSAVGLSQATIVQVRGSFAKAEAGYEFVPDELYIGSLPLHSIPRLSPLIINRVIAAQNLPEDLKAAWKKLNLVAVEDNALRLVLP